MNPYVPYLEEWRDLFPRSKAQRLSVLVKHFDTPPNGDYVSRWARRHRLPSAPNGFRGAMRFEAEIYVRMFARQHVGQRILALGSEAPLGGVRACAEFESKEDGIYAGRCSLSPYGDCFLPPIDNSCHFLLVRRDITIYGILWMPYLLIQFSILWILGKKPEF